MTNLHTTVSLSGYYWEVFTSDGAREDAYCAKDADYAVHEEVVPEWLLAALRRDGWPVDVRRGTVR